MTRGDRQDGFALHALRKSIDEALVPLYRAQREAEEDAVLQWIENSMRVIFLRPIRRTSDEARREALRARGYGDEQAPRT